ncbi:MAG: transglycosylase SLT domain-containing protein [Rhizobiales bacterium]|nr:transglycosylase SLT domain-containing protein [Hyphomicrobiales bacterium]
MMKARRLLAAIVLAAASASGAAAAPEKLKLGVCEAEIARASAKFGVPLPILYAVGLTESGGNGTLQPLLVATKTVSYVGKDRTDAIRKFNEIRATGTELIDLGCLQANYYWHKAEFNSLEEMFDPRANVEQAARFLSELYKRHKSWVMAAARYNAGPKNTPAQQRYVCNVMRNLVRSGFGSWTAQAKAFCDAPPDAVGTPVAQAAPAGSAAPSGSPAAVRPGAPVAPMLPAPGGPRQVVSMPLLIAPVAMGKDEADAADGDQAN